jgi:hypothetical protein
MFADVEGLAIVLVPFAKAALAEVVFVVAKEFFQAGPRDVGELQLALFGSGRNLAAFCDVLVATARRLHHLVVRARAPAYEAVAEADGGVVDDLGFVVGEEILVTTVQWDEAGIGRRRPRRRMARVCLFVTLVFLALSSCIATAPAS